MRIRPCIDLRAGQVVQIVGGTLRDGAEPATNFTSARPAADFAALYRAHALPGGHVIALGPGNADAARSALAAWPGGLQFGGGVDADNAAGWLEAGAAAVIVTSWLFPDGRFDADRLHRLQRRVGRERLVLDLSCRRRDGRWWVVTDRWQRFTDVALDAPTLAGLGGQCAELLVHGVDVEGLRQGIEAPLVELLAAHAPVPVTYAGGVRHLADLDRVERLGAGRVDATVGSALDLFGGDLPFAAVIDWHRQRNHT